MHAHACGCLRCTADACSRLRCAACRHIVARRIKSLYQLLGQDTRALSNAALHLLGCVAGHSTATARDLAAAFDFSLTALAKLAKPPR